MNRFKEAYNEGYEAGFLEQTPKENRALRDSSFVARNPYDSKSDDELERDLAEEWESGYQDSFLKN